MKEHKLTKQELKEIKERAELWCDRHMFSCPHRDNDTIDDCIHPETVGKGCCEIAICPAWRDK